MSRILYTICVVFFFANCTTQPTETVQTGPQKQEDILQLSSEEIQIAEIQTGKLIQQPIFGHIDATGLLDVPPNNKVTIAAPMAGFVKNTFVLQGTLVKKGDVIIELQNQEFIQLQQDYVDGISQLAYLEAEYNRQQQLASEQINTQKIAQQSKAAYLSMLAKVKGLKAKLKLIGIDINSIEKGEIDGSIQLKAPISGYVTQVNVNRGSYVNSADLISVIVNTEHLHAELTLFEKDINQVKEGQQVFFTLGNETTQRKAHVHLIGREIKADRSIQVHCHLDDEDKNLIPGAYLKAEIQTEKKLAWILPDAAIIQFEGKEFVFTIPTEGKFKLTEVKTGLKENGRTELVNPDSSLMKATIVTQGGYHLMGKLKNTEEG